MHKDVRLPTPSQIFDGLNEAQKQTVMKTDGPLLVVAGPGTGKTLTIVRRIAWLVQKGVPPGQILAVTFTNRAAREMRERAEAFLGNDTRSIFIGTFHLLGLRIIQEQSGGSFTLCNRDEQLEILKTITKGTAKTVQRTAETISRIKNLLQEPGEASEILAAYQEALRQKNALDFDDLIRVPIELLADQAAAVTWRSRFRSVLVDEYQDINPAQYRLLRLLTASSDSICAVGDSDQAIYSFRGADINNFLNFERDFPGAARITLSRNYRSTSIIVDASNAVVRKNRNRIDKQVEASGSAGSPILLVSAPDDRTEGSMIAGEIEARMGGMTHETACRNTQGADGSYRFSDFAVIYRTNAQARALQDAFAASGIPVQVLGRPDAAQRRDAEETLAFLRSLARSKEPADDQPAPARAAEAALLTEADFFDPRADAVALMTMHMAKGLEFRVVFIAGCENGLVPCTVMKDGVDIEEERRLFYVAMTRARAELVLSHARSRFLYGEHLGQKVSPFAREIPDQFIETRLISDRVRKEKPEDRQLGLF